MKSYWYKIQLEEIKDANVRKKESQLGDIKLQLWDKVTLWEIKSHLDQVNNDLPTSWLLFWETSRIIKITDFTEVFA